MGAYNAKPVVEKETERGEGAGLKYAATSMQGWRINQEDAHNCIADLTDGWSMFAVYDGHGGHETSKYTAAKFPDFLRNSKFSSSEDVCSRLQETFVEFDDSLRSPEVVTELRAIADEPRPEREDDSEDERDNIEAIEESRTPIEQILAKYSYMRSISAYSLLRGDNNEGTTPRVKKERSKRTSKSPLVDTESKRSKSNGEDAADENKDETAEKPVANGAEEEAGSSETAEKKTKPATNGEAEDTVKGVTVSKSSSVEIVKTVDGTTSAVEVTTTEVTVTSPVKERTKKSSKPILKEKPVQDDALAEDDSDDEDFNEDELVDESDESDEDEEENDEDEEDGVEESSDDEEEDDEEEEEDDGVNARELMLGGPRGEVPGEDSGTTACVCLMAKDKIIVANVGDSRAVLSRAGRAVDLSIDHKPEDDIEKTRITRAGGQVTEDGRVNGGLNLSRAFGDHFYKKNTQLPLKDQMISAFPDVRLESLHPEEDEFVVVACDGIWNSLDSQQVIDYVRARLLKGETPEKITEEICDSCLAPSTAGDGTGCDNMTVIIVLLPKSVDIIGSEPGEAKQATTAAETGQVE